MHAFRVSGPLPRRFGAALIASLAAHAAALSVSLPVPRVALFGPPAVLQVVLPEPGASPAAAPEPVGRDVPAPLREKRSPPATRHRAPARVVGEVEPVPSALARAAEDEPVRATSPVETPLTAPAPAAPVALHVPLPLRSRSDLLSAYGQTISQALARFKEYPRIAQMQGWQGAVTMRLRVAQSGRLLEAEVHASSGYAALDRQALAMAANAGRLPAPPEGLDEPEVTVLVPVVFRLER